MGYLQQQIIDLGKEEGFVTTNMVTRFYPPKEVERVMNKLVLKGYFKPGEDCVAYVKWKYIGS